MPTLDNILKQELARCAIGPRWLARMMPSIEYEMATDVDAPSEAVLQLAEYLLAMQGYLRPDIADLSEIPTVVGVVGSEVFNLNPAIVSVEVTPLSEDKCRMRLFGVAKEGLIKQRTAEKAVRRLTAQMLPPAT